MGLTVMWPCTGFWITSTWAQHLARPGYNRNYAGTDLARGETELWGSQYGGKVLQSMWSTQGYGYTTFVEYSSDTGPVLRIRNAHQKNLYLQVGDPVDPDTVLGIMDSTGNSTGPHTHYEVWLMLNGMWQNIDPLNAIYQLTMVYDKSALVPLTGEPPVPEPEYTPPVIPAWPVVKPTAVIAGSTINLRIAPYVGAQIVGAVKFGEQWRVIDVYLDNYTNTWLRLYRERACGWAAAHYGGEQWLEEVTA